ncbi:MAG: nucleotidyl transferase AbiEii/AbiGii toxin family protein [Sterolibacterium sp.]
MSMELEQEKARAMSMFDLIRSLSNADIDFVLVGGLAVALHGYQRVTMDVDVVLAMTPENLRRFIDCAKAAGLRPVIPVPIDALADPDRIEQWHREKGMLAFALRGPDMMATVIDVLVRPVVSFAELKRDAVMAPVGTLTIPIASIEHLIAMKTGTGRSKDAIDIEELRKLQAPKSC